MRPLFNLIARVFSCLALPIFLSAEAQAGGVIHIVGPSAVMEKAGYAYFDLVADPAPLGGNWPSFIEVRTSGSATGGDYRNLTTSVSIQPWQAPDRVVLELHQDGIVEVPEEIVIEFARHPNDMSGYAMPEPFRVRLIDDETITTPAVEIIGSRALREDVASAEFEARLNRPVQETLRVQWRLAGDTAVAGEDFVAAEGTLEFPPNETSARFQIRITDDSKIEGVERLSLELFDASPGLYVPAAAHEFLIQDDDQGYRFADSYTYASEDAGVHRVNIQRVGSFDFPSTVQVRMEGVTAIEGVDFPNEIYTVEFLPDERFATLTFRLLNDELEDSIKELRLVMMNPSEGLRLVEGEETMRVIIYDNEGGYRFSSEGNLIEGDGAYASMHRMGDYVSPSEVTVTFKQGEAANGIPAATAGADFHPASVIVRFAEGEKVARVPMPLIDDALVEDVELVAVEFSPSVWTPGALAQGVAYIFDNEFNPLPAHALDLDGLTLWQFAQIDGENAFALATRDFDGRILLRLNSGGVDARFEPVAYSGYQRLLTGVNGTVFIVDGVNQVRRLKADGTVDPAFAPCACFNGLLGTAGAYDGGLFFAEVGEPRHMFRVVKIRPDGLPDPSFAPPQINGEVRFLAATPDGGVYVASPFPFIVGGRQTTVAKFQADGSLDPSVISQDIFVSFMSVEGQIFALSGNQWRRLLPTGAIDPNFSPIPGWIDRPLLPDASGRFHQFGSHFFRYTPDGVLDPTYFPGTLAFRQPGGAPGPDAAVILGGSLFISGPFTHVNGTLLGWDQRNSARVDLEPGYPHFQLAPDRGSLLEASAALEPFRVLRAGNNFDSPATVRYRVRSGSAVVGEDLPLQEGEVSFAAGVSQADIHLSAINDLLAENDETFYVEFSLADGTPVGRSDVILESDEMGLTILIDRPSNQISLVAVGLGRGSAMLETSSDLIEWTFAGNLQGIDPFPIYPNENNPKRFYRLRR